MRILRLDRVLPGAAAGLIAWVVDVPVTVSLAVLIFSGSLSSHLSGGIGLALFGVLVVGTVVALTSSLPGTVAVLQDGPAAILAILAAEIARGMASVASPEQTLATVVAAMAIASVLTGACFLALGWFGLGGLTRYIPYPVIGGFLGGTGCLLVRGAIGMMTDLSFSVASLPSLFQPALLIRWLPGLVFGVLLLAVLRRYNHFLTMPGMLLAAITLFYVLLWATGTSLGEATAQGWLLGPLPQGALWQPLTLATLRQVHWPAIWDQAGNIVTILVVSVISLLINTSALEVTARQDIDLNRELRSAGLGNVIAGLGGGLTGHQALSLSALSHRIGADSRLVGLTMALLSGAMLFFGAPALSFFPKPVVGGLILFLGLDFVVDWLYDARLRLSRPEYAIVLLILIAMNVLGTLASVGLGVLFAIVLFVLSYSRIGVVKHTLSGQSYHSNVDRSRRDRQILQGRGDWLYILELQGFIFFGTAKQLLDQVRLRVQDPDLPKPRFLVLDFRQVGGVDASAALSFVKMKQLAQAQGIVLVFTRLSTRVHRQLAREVLSEEDRALWRVEADLDHGVEWCEEQILQLAEGQQHATEPGAEPPPRDILPTADLSALLGQGSAQHKAPGLSGYVEQMDVPQGSYLIRQGDAPNGLYFVESGQVTAERVCADGSVVRLRKMGPGTVVGEIGLYLGSVATASVVTNQPSTIYYLSLENLKRMEETAPQSASALHRYLAQLLSDRLAYTVNALQALLEEPEE